MFKMRLAGVEALLLEHSISRLTRLLKARLRNSLCPMRRSMNNGVVPAKARRRFYLSANARSDINPLNPCCAAPPQSR
ncbi:hypothetical protein PUN4_800028 [Paraburkholderia unamae]|nr:hypothetical protein PUN4_800028 [Paraburkholderia unamae]